MEAASTMHVEEVIAKETKSSRGGKRSKRKWREIEDHMERRRLLKELKEMDLAFDCSPEDLEI